MIKYILCAIILFCLTSCSDKECQNKVAQLEEKNKNLNEYVGKLEERIVLLETTKEPIEPPVVDPP
jgi:hypothetical protein